MDSDLQEVIESPIRAGAPLAGRQKSELLMRDIALHNIVYCNAFPLATGGMWQLKIDNRNSRYTMTPIIMDDKEHKVILQVTKADAVQQLVIIGQLKNILKALPQAKIKVVCHGQGLPLVIAAQSESRQHVRKLIQQGVAFAACENTMARKKVRNEDLLPGISTVPSALVEIILKQEAGWSYVKAGL